MYMKSPFGAPMLPVDKRGMADARVQQAPVPAAPEPPPAGLLAPAQEQQARHGLLGDIGAGVTSLIGLPFNMVSAYASAFKDAPAQMRDAAAARALMIEDRRAAMADMAAMTPEQRNAARLNAKAAGEAMSSHFAAYKLGPGEVWGHDGDVLAGAPKLEFNGDQAFSFDPISKTMTRVGERAPTFAEQTARIEALLRYLAEQQKLTSQEGRDGMPEGMHYSVKDGKPTWTMDPAYPRVAGLKHAPKLGGLGAGTSGGVPVPPSVVDPMAAVAAELRRRGKL